MSYCKSKGKDTVIFVSKEDHLKPSTVKITEEDDDEEPGLILASGDINWSCPCLGGMATGPCGPQFREAFSCFHYSKEEPKGSDCFEPFRAMQECMAKFPVLYDVDDKKEESELDTDMPDYPKDIDKVSEKTQNEKKDTVDTKEKSS